MISTSILVYVKTHHPRTLLCRGTTNDKGVGSNRGLDLGSSKVDDLAVLLEHVHLLNSRDGLGIDLLQGTGQLGLLTSRALAGLLHLAANSSLAANAGLGLQLG